MNSVRERVGADGLYTSVRDARVAAGAAETLASGLCCEAHLLAVCTESCVKCWL